MLLGEYVPARAEPWLVDIHDVAKSPHYKLWS